MISFCCQSQTGWLHNYTVIPHKDFYLIESWYTMWGNKRHCVMDYINVWVKFDLRCQIWFDWSIWDNIAFSEFYLHIDTDQSEGLLVFCLRWWLIDCLLVTERSMTSISCIFWIKTNTAISKTDTRMRERWDNRVNYFWMPL